LGPAGLPPHDPAHSHPGAALRAGADPKTVQHNLGHASAAMTLDTYAAYTTDAATEAARRLSDYWHDATN
jgi:integrase